jgi:hypothetical protein
MIQNIVITKLKKKKTNEQTIDAGDALVSRMVRLYLADGAEGKPMAAGRAL